MTDPVVGRPHMPGYGVPDGTEGALPWEWALERIQGCRRFFLATTRPDGRAHAMPLWGVWTDGRFVFSTAITSVKSRNLQANAFCAITAECDKDAIVLEGRAELVELTEVPGLASAYDEKYGEKIEAGPVWALRPDTAFAFIEDDSFATTATRWRWRH